MTAAFGLIRRAFPVRPESVSLRGACVPRGEVMATTVRETIADLGRFGPDQHTPEHRRLRPAYGFDGVAIVPGVETLHPDDVDLSWELGGQRFAIPFIASAMDGGVSVPFAAALGTLAGLARLSLVGLRP